MRASSVALRRDELSGVTTERVAAKNFKWLLEAMQGEAIFAQSRVGKANQEKP
jgi:hypothetical protein